jgi:hypothetical protein
LVAAAGNTLGMLRIGLGNLVVDGGQSGEQLSRRRRMSIAQQTETMDGHGEKGKRPYPASHI